MNTAPVGRRPAVTVWARPEPPGPLSDLVLTPADIRRLVRNREILRWTGRFSEAVVEQSDLRLPRAPFLTTTAARLLAPRRVLVRAADGGEAAVGLSAHLTEGSRFARDLAALPLVHRQAAQLLAELGSFEGTGRRHRAPPTGRPVYVRTDLNVALAAGGSVAHVAGVVNGLQQMNLQPLLVTPEPAAGVRPDVEVLPVPRPRRFLDFPATAVRNYNLVHAKALSELVAGCRVSWIYHRYSLGSFSTALVARRLGVPLVLEYNGSEVWAGSFWGGKQASSTDARIEQAMLRLANLVVVVSETLRSELIDRGVDDRRILVNPNGVDTDRYNPAVEAEALRTRLGLGGKLIVGFIGTFGRWHGAEVLAEAYRKLAQSRPDVAGTSHLLLIGDGPQMPEVRRHLDGFSGATITGTVPQEQGPAYLAACDILVAPHVPNPDGSPFFGSPTKVFEYMAMGKGIVASRLGQIGDVLADGETAVLVNPGSVTELAAAIHRLLVDAGLRNRLGAAARATAVDRHTWRAHTERIVRTVEDVCR